LPAANVEQLAALGIPRPGHPYWTQRTIRRVQLRYPGWNLDPWRAALAVPNASTPAAYDPNS
jgi:hypothetical protein